MSGYVSSGTFILPFGMLKEQSIAVKLEHAEVNVCKKIYLNQLFQVWDVINIQLKFLRFDG